MPTTNPPIGGTDRRVWPNAAPTNETPSGDVWLTAWLPPRRSGALDVEKAKALGATSPLKRTYPDRASFAKATDADPADLELLRGYCKTHGIDVVATHWRSATLTGPIEKLIDAFGATAAIYALPDGRRFRHRSGALHAPPEIAAVLRGPFGIHQWPRSHAVGPLQNSVTPLSANDIAARYQFPDADGSGVTVGVLQLRATFDAGDFAACMQAQGVKAKTPIVVRVDNAELAHQIETAKDLESAIDAQIVGALAPGAQLVIYAAPDDECGVLDGIRKALFDEENAPTILSISFGLPEERWTPVALEILDELFAAAALLGVTILCASGDKGAHVDPNGEAQVLAPASSPFAHACGATQIAAGDSSAESGWLNSGGGFSGRVPVPSWQTTASAVAAQYKVAPGRGVPDFAAETVPGYMVYVGGKPFAMGGTSAVAPAWAALVARINQRLGKPAGFFAPLLYAAVQSPLREITSGGNDRYQCAPGWNPCTGLGVPVGTALEAALR